MNNILILADSRQQKDKYITDHFNKNLIMWVRAGLPSGDYMAVRYNDGFVKDYSIIIDTKKDVEEMAHNLCNTTEHERIKREISKARELGCERFIFLICDNKIKGINDLINWQSNKTKVKGITLAKIMQTMAKKYKIEFIFTSKEMAGSRIFEILNKK
ncbi:ERCC4 domain-containing protein [uncultured Rikenella sp.]|uniref:ERCC4 domain-containing protein n=1 Tax=uncultured Rikenella sp. TaxID=368003 RepID=UPI002616DDE7|nr:ERCC4 domain-containing protein [uncultured Rikenella sp.]